MAKVYSSTSEAFEAALSKRYDWNSDSEDFDEFLEIVRANPEVTSVESNIYDDDDTEETLLIKICGCDVDRNGEDRIVEAVLEILRLNAEHNPQRALSASLIDYLDEFENSALVVALESSPKLAQALVDEGASTLHPKVQEIVKDEDFVERSEEHAQIAKIILEAEAKRLASAQEEAKSAKPSAAMLALLKAGKTIEALKRIKRHLKRDDFRGNCNLIAVQDVVVKALVKEVAALVGAGKATEALQMIKGILNRLPGNSDLIQAFIQTSAEAGKEVLETLETIDKHLDCLPGDDHLISAKERLEQQILKSKLAEVENNKYDAEQLPIYVSRAREWAFAKNLGGPHLKALLGQVPDWTKTHEEWLRAAVSKRSEQCVLGIALSKGYQAKTSVNYLVEQIHTMALRAGGSTKTWPAGTEVLWTEYDSDVPEGTVGIVVDYVPEDYEPYYRVQFPEVTYAHSIRVEELNKTKEEMQKCTPERQDLLLLYLCVALYRSAQPLKLQSLGAESVSSCIAAARRRLKDTKMQAKQMEKARKSAEISKTIEGFQPLGTRATKQFLEANILEMLCLLGDPAKPQGDVARKFVNEVVLASLKSGLQMQIDAARDITAMLEKIYRDKRVVHRSMYVAKLKAIADADFFKFNKISSNVATICDKKLGDKKNFHQSTESLVNFYRHSNSVEPKYRKFVHALAEKTNAVYGPARVKGAHRALEKMALRMDGKQWNANNVCDGVRGALIYAETRNILTVLCLIVSAAADPDLSSIGKGEGWDAATAGVKEKIDVLRVKNRFAKPTSGGWADFMVSFRFRSDPNQHVCELQLCHQDLFIVRKQMGAHHGYAQFRSALELLEATGHVDRIEAIEGEDEAIDVTKFNTVTTSAVPAGELGMLKAKVKALEAKVKSLEDELSLTQELAATKAAETKATVDKIVAALKRASISL